MNHTPGPWIANRSGNKIEIGRPWPADGREKPPHAIGTVVAVTTGSSAVANADAMVMAASPCLLSFLETLRELCDEGDTTAALIELQGDYCADLIARAKGGA